MCRKSRKSKGLITPIDLYIVAIVFFIGIGLFLVLQFLSAKEIIISKQDIRVSQEIDDRGSEIISLLGSTSGGMLNMEIVGNTFTSNSDKHNKAAYLELEETRKRIKSGFSLSILSSSGASYSQACIHTDSESHAGELEWPVVRSSPISSRPGFRMHPIDNVCKCHSGVDISGGNLEVKAAASGKVTRVQSLTAGYGKNVMITHTSSLGEEYQTLYGHLSEIRVAVGQDVAGGQTIIGLSGNTGDSTSPHLHFEVRKNGMPINPCAFIKDVPAGCRVEDRCSSSGEVSYSSQVPLPGAQTGNLKKTLELFK